MILPMLIAAACGPAVARAADPAPAERPPKLLQWKVEAAPALPAGSVQLPTVEVTGHRDAFQDADQRLKKEKDLKSRESDLGFAQRKFQEDLQNRDRELTQEMMGKIRDVISAVAKEKGADLVVQDAIVITPSADITADVLKRLNGAK